MNLRRENESGRGQPHSKCFANPQRYLSPPGLGVRLSSAALAAARPDFSHSTRRRQQPFDEISNYPRAFNASHITHHASRITPLDFAICTPLRVKTLNSKLKTKQMPAILPSIKIDSHSMLAKY